MIDISAPHQIHEMVRRRLEQHPSRQFRSKVVLVGGVGCKCRLSGKDQEDEDNEHESSQFVSRPRGARRTQRCVKLSKLGSILAVLSSTWAKPRTSCITTQKEGLQE